MSSLETRLSKLERSYTEPSLLERLLAAQGEFTDEQYLALDHDTRRGFACILIEAITPVERKVVDGLIDRFDVFPFNPFALERLRGHMPDALLRDAYLMVQCWGSSGLDESVRGGLSRLAGVIDDSGIVAAGYVLSNGCIVPEPTALSQPEPTKEGAQT